MRTIELKSDQLHSDMFEVHLDGELLSKLDWHVMPEEVCQLLEELDHEAWLKEGDEHTMLIVDDTNMGYLDEPVTPTELRVLLEELDHTVELSSTLEDDIEDTE